MRSLWKAAAVVPLALSLTLGMSLGAPVAQAQGNPFERGPDPTLEALEAEAGPFETAEESVSGFVTPGFGDGTIYYPTDTSEGKFGAIALVPGYTLDKGTLAWMGPKLASHGFVVFLINPDSALDQPHQRGDDLLSALDWLTTESSVAGQIDATRLGVGGHSMGGGGTLQAAADRPELQAAVPFAPWNLNRDWSGVTVPTFIFGGQTDLIAPVGTHARPFFDSLPKQNTGYMELAGQGHFFPQSDIAPMSVTMISWFKRFIDNDTRYEQFLCPPPSGLEIAEYLDTCPHSTV